MSEQNWPFPATVNELKAIGIVDPFATGSPLETCPFEQSIVSRDPLMRRELELRSTQQNRPATELRPGRPADRSLSTAAD